MKYFYSVIFIITISFAANAQTGIGTPTPSPSSVLDLTATDKGVLIPRLALSSSTDVTTITKGNVNSLLVFNTRTVSDVMPGFYYWFNGKWNKIIVPEDIVANLPATRNELTLTDTQLTTTVNGVTSNVADLSGLTGWGLAGNEGADESFLGTKNAQSLRFRTDDTERMMITAAGNIGIGTAVPNAKLDIYGNARVRTMVAGNATDQIVSVDTNGLLKKISFNNVGKTYTAGTGIDVAGTVISAATANKIDLVGKNLTTTVNGVSDTVDLTPALAAATTVSNTSAENKLSTTVNGVKGAEVTIINTNELKLTGAQLTTTVNGVSDTVDLTPALAAATTVSNVSAANRLSTAVNGVEGTEVAIINTNELTLTDTQLTTTVNGVTSNVADLSGLTGWGLAGNEGTTAGFLGTTNAQPLRFRTNDTEKMTITADGNVGIGIAAPTAPLHFANREALRKIVLFGGANDFQFYGFGISTSMFRSSITNTGGNFGWFTGTSATTSSELMRLTGGGNLGIGTATPGAKLDVLGDARVRTMVAGNATDEIVSVDRNGLLKKMPFNDVVKNYTAGTGVDITGTVISAPTTNILTFAGAELISRVNGVESKTDLSGLSGWGLTGNEATATSFLGTKNVQPLRFITNDTEKMTITADGNVGIGIATPKAPLHFANSLAPRKIVLYGGDNDFQFYGFGISTSMFRSNISNTGGNFGWFTGTSATESNELMRLTGTGNLGIGTAAPDAKLDVLGDARVRTMVAGNATDEIVSVDRNGLLKKMPLGNGINVTGGTIGLGGELIAPTTIVTNAANTFKMTGLQPSTSPGTDEVLVVGVDGTLKKATVTSTNTSYITSSPVGSGETASITLDVNSTYSTFMIALVDTCGQEALAMFASYDNMLAFIGGQARDTPYVSTTVGRTVTLTANVGSCGGGGNTHWDFTITKNGRTLSFVNHSAVSKNIRVRHSTM